MNLRRFLAERELLVTFGVFGITQMSADLLADLDRGTWSALLRGVGIIVIIGLLWLSRRSRQPLLIPLMLIECSGREVERTKLDCFLRQTGLERAAKAIDSCSSVKREDLVLSIKSDLRNSTESVEWERAFQSLVQAWSKDVDEPLERLSLSSGAGRCYHIRPNIVIPMAFAAGSAVGLRRSIVLYHTTPQGKCHRVIDLQQPRRLHEPPDDKLQGLQVLPEGIEPPSEFGERLILHLVISDRHPPNFNAHPDFTEALNVAIYYNQALLNEADWLPCVQTFVLEAKKWINRFQQVELCLICPDAVAFALGMAFSRTPHLKICHWFAGEYLPVIDLRSREKSLAFN